MSGSALCDRNGREVRLGDKLGEGGEGAVYEIADQPNSCAKIYAPGKASEREGKVRAMLMAPPQDPASSDGGISIAWPTSTLHERATSLFIGFVMPRAQRMQPVHRFLVNDERMQFAAWLTWRDLHAVAARIAATMAAVHKAGHCVGDVNPLNILVSTTRPAVTIIDTDSFQIRDRRGSKVHRCLVVSDDYLAPELHFKEPASVDRTPESDAYALAILVFQLLMLGTHPFDGVLRDHDHLSHQEKMRAGLAPVAGARGGRGHSIRQPRSVVPLATLNRGLRAHFRRCFGEGSADKTRRLTAEQWRVALEKSRDALVRCTRNGSHWFDRTYARCQWCERFDRIGFDAFPAGQDWQLREVAGLENSSKASLLERTRWFRLHVQGRLDDKRLTRPERDWLRKVGMSLPLDTQLVERVIAEEVRATGSIDESTPQPPAATKLRASARPSRAGSRSPRPPPAGPSTQPSKPPPLPPTRPNSPTPPLVRPSGPPSYSPSSPPYAPPSASAQQYAPASMLAPQPVYQPARPPAPARPTPSGALSSLAVVGVLVGAVLIALVGAGSPSCSHERAQPNSPVEATPPVLPPPTTAPPPRDLATVHWEKQPACVFRLSEPDLTYPEGKRLPSCAPNGTVVEVLQSRTIGTVGWYQVRDCSGRLVGAFWIERRFVEHPYVGVSPPGCSTL